MPEWDWYHLAMAYAGVGLWSAVFGLMQPEVEETIGGSMDRGLDLDIPPWFVLGTIWVLMIGSSLLWPVWLIQALFSQDE